MRNSRSAAYGASCELQRCYKAVKCQTRLLLRAEETGTADGWQSHTWCNSVYGAAACLVQHRALCGDATCYSSCCSCLYAARLLLCHVQKHLSNPLCYLRLCSPAPQCTWFLALPVVFDTQSCHELYVLLEPVVVVCCHISCVIACNFARNTAECVPDAD